MKSHRYTFWGSSTAMTLKSDDCAEPHVMLTFIKKKGEKEWEKFVDGKTVKISLHEIAALLSVARNEQPKWETYHKANGSDGVRITAHFENGKNPPALVIAAGGYIRPVEGPLLAVLISLLQHLFEEKIANGTGPTASLMDTPPEDAGLEEKNPEMTTVSQPNTHAAVKPAPIATPKAKEAESQTTIAKAPPVKGSKAAPKQPVASVEDGVVQVVAARVPRVTEKAIQVANDSGTELWVPKSAIADGVTIPTNPHEVQWTFTIKTWFARKPDFLAWATGGEDPE